MNTTSNRTLPLSLALAGALSIFNSSATADCIDARARNPNMPENIGAVVGTVVGILAGTALGEGQPDIVIIGGELGCDFGSSMVKHAVEAPHAMFVLGGGIYALGKFSDGREVIVFVDKAIAEAVEDFEELATSEVPPSPTTGDIAGMAVTAPTLATSVATGKIADKLGVSESVADLSSTLVLLSNPTQVLVEVAGLKVGGDVGDAVGRLSTTVATGVDRTLNSVEKRAKKLGKALRF